jgi:hypothetical protein
LNFRYFSTLIIQLIQVQYFAPFARNCRLLDDADSLFPVPKPAKTQAREEFLPFGQALPMLPCDTT